MTRLYDARHTVDIISKHKCKKKFFRSKITELIMRSAYSDTDDRQTTDATV